MRDAKLKTEIQNGQLIISIGIDTLCEAISVGRNYGMNEIVITDNDIFAAEILQELNDESEDGSTAVHGLLDDAATRAIDNGAEGADYDDV